MNLQRELLSTKTEAQYFDIAELEKQTGKPRYRFDSVIAKELIDNALDACESANVLPEIGIFTSSNETHCALLVTDNAAGIPAALVEKLLDYNSRTSSNAAYKAPTRGAQGNAFKTIVGIAHALNGSLSISAQGVLHRISATVTPAGDVALHHVQQATNPHEGTRILVTLSKARFDAGTWAFNSHLFNPHANVKTGDFEWQHLAWLFEKGEISETTIFYTRTSDIFKKHRPTDPASIHWYEPGEFYGLTYRLATQTSQTLNQFVRSFHGLSSTRLAKMVIDTAGVSGLQHDEAANDRLYKAMIEVAKPIKPAALGLIGESHFLNALSGTHVYRHWYRKAEVMLGGKPYLFKILIAEIKGEGNFFHGINHAASFEDFAAGKDLAAGDVHGMGIGGFLQSAHVHQENGHVAIAHLVSPALVMLDRGKTRVNLPREVIGTIAMPS